MTVQIPARAVSAGPGASTSDGALRSSDPRVGLVPNAAGNQLSGLDTLLDLMANRTLVAGDRAAVLEPGTFRKSGDLAYAPVTGHRSLSLHGYGSRSGQHAPSVILDTADAGDGAWGLHITGGLTPLYDIADISFQGLGPSVVYGMPGWAMRGVQAIGRGSLRDLDITGYQAAIGIDGDHQNIHDIVAVGNVYGIDFYAGGTSQGDIVFRKFQADGNAKAGIGVAAGRVLAGCAFIDGSGGQAPYMLHRYPVVGAPDVTGSWMTGVVFDRWAIEFCGNGVVYDEVQDGAGISNIDWIGVYTDWGLFNPAREWVYNGESKPKLASWYNAGPIGDFRIHQGFPGLGGGLPSFKASGITNITAPHSGELVLPKLVAGERAFEASGGFYDGCSIGRPGAIWIKPYRLASGTLSRGELIVANNEKDVRPLSAGATTGDVLGVATQSCDSAVQATRCVCALKGGNSSDTGVKNTSGSTIPPNTYLKPHSAGGVQAVNGTNDPIAARAIGEQVIGRSTASIANDAVGPAHLFGMPA